MRSNLAIVRGQKTATVDDQLAAIRTLKAISKTETPELRDKILEALLECLSKRQPKLRVAAAQVFGKRGIGEPRVIKGLIEILGDDDPATRDAARSSLLAHGQSANSLIEEAIDEGKKNRVELIKTMASLVKFHGPEDFKKFAPKLEKYAQEGSTELQDVSLELLIMLKPEKHGQAYFVEANNLAKSGKSDLALFKLRLAEAKNPKESKYRRFAGVIYLHAKKDQAKALEAFSKACEIDPENAENYLKRASLFDKLKQGEKALADFNKAVERAPSNPVAYNNRAMVLMKMKRPKDAVRDLTQALKIDPKAQTPLFNRGLYYWQTKAYDKADKDFTKLIELNPKEPRFLLFKGKIDVKLKRAQSAFDNLTKALTLKPDYHQARAQRGELLVAAKKFDLAIKDLTAALKARPDDPSALQALTNAFIAKKDLKKALKPLNHLVKIAPKNINAVFQHACINYDLKNFQKAVDGFTATIKLDPKKKPLAYFYRGNILKQANKKILAAKDFLEFAKHHPKDANPVRLAAACLYEAKQFDKALEILAVALKIKPDYPDGLILKGAIYNTMRQPNKAIAAFNKVMKLLPKNASTHYNMACSLALRAQVRGKDEAAERKRDIDLSYKFLELSVTYGFNNRALIDKDVDINILREDPRWSDFKKRYTALEAKRAANKAKKNP